MSSSCAEDKRVAQAEKIKLRWQEKLMLLLIVVVPMSFLHWMGLSPKIGMGWLVIMPIIKDAYWLAKYGLPKEKANAE